MGHGKRKLPEGVADLQSILSRANRECTVRSRATHFEKVFILQPVSLPQGQADLVAISSVSDVPDRSLTKHLRDEENNDSSEDAATCQQINQ